MQYILSLCSWATPRRVGGSARVGQGHPEARQPDESLLPRERRGGDPLLELHRGGAGDDQHGAKVPV